MKKHLLVGPREGFGLIEIMIVIFIVGVIASLALPQFREVYKTAKTAKVIGELRAFKEAQGLYYARKGSYAIVDCQDGQPCGEIEGFIPSLDMHIRTFPGSSVRRGFYASASHKALELNEAKCINVGDTAAVAPPGFSHSQPRGNFYSCSVAY